MSFIGVGFGHGSFGNFPFGKADFGEDVVIRSFADYCLEDENDSTGVNQRLLNYLTLIKNSVNRVKDQIDVLPDQIDFNTVREDLLTFLGKSFAITIDDVEPAEFQRSLVGGAILFFRIKGTLEAYKIRGKISGFDVDVFTLYKLDPIYVPMIPSDNLFNLPTGSSDYYTDLAPGTVSGTPTTDQCGYCATSSLKMTFTIVKPQPPAVLGQPNIFDRIVAKLRDVIPIHIRELLFEIVAIIVADEHQYLASSVNSDEQTWTPAAGFARFDAFTADTAPVDAHGYITGSTNLA